MALNYLSFLNKDPVTKPTGHEPLATFTHKLASGAQNYHGLPVAADDRPIFGGKGPRALLTKPVAVPPAVRSDIPLPFRGDVYNANALHVPDLETLGAEAGRRRFERVKEVAARTYVPKPMAGLGMLFKSEQQAVENRLLDKRYAMERMGYTPAEIEEATADDRRILYDIAQRRAQAESGTSYTGERVARMMGYAPTGVDAMYPGTERTPFARRVLADLEAARGGDMEAQAANGGAPIFHPGAPVPELGVHDGDVVMNDGAHPAVPPAAAEAGAPAGGEEAAAGAGAGAAERTVVTNVLGSIDELFAAGGRGLLDEELVYHAGGKLDAEAFRDYVSVLDVLNAFESGVAAVETAAKDLRAGERFRVLRALAYRMEYYMDAIKNLIDSDRTTAEEKALLRERWAGIAGRMQDLR